MTETSHFSLLKISGAGNTFAVIDARPGSAWVELEKKLSLSRPRAVQKICHPVFGVQADGALFIEEAQAHFDFKWDFYNSDGSTAEMCGNAARCAARFCGLLNAKFLESEIHFETGAGLVTAQILKNSLVKVQMPEVKVLKNPIQLKSHSSALESFVFINTGVPHLVQKIHTLVDLKALKEMAQEMRSHPDLGSAGSNVTFYVEKSKEKIEAATFERGVEDYTLACGTGAVAAAKAHSIEVGALDIEVKMPGGVLQVLFDKNASRPLMTGEALIIGEFKYNTEVLK